MVSIDDIKKLRDKTGHSIGKCKEALEECGGDIDAAMEVLRERGAIAAEKKADRELGSGVIQSYIHTNNAIGAMVEVLCETDFVAKNEEIVTLARDIAMHCAAFQPRYASREEIPEDVLEQLTGELKEGIDTGKPQDVQEKILEGKLDARLKEVILLDQPFVKDDTRTVRNLVNEAVQKFGERIEVGRIIVWKI